MDNFLIVAPRDGRGNEYADSDGRGTTLVSIVSMPIIVALAMQVF